MKALIYKGARQLAIEEREMPVPKKGSAAEGKGMRNLRIGYSWLSGYYRKKSSGICYGS